MIRSGLLMAFLIGAARVALAQVPERVIEIPTRPGVTQRFLYLVPARSKNTVIMFVGGSGNLQINPDGSLGAGRGNFLARSRQLFAAQGMTVALVDAPSDHQSPPYLSGIRQRAEHVADIKAVIAWLRQQAGQPVWLIGTSRGTQSAAFIATQLDPAAGGPDGLVLTSTILNDKNGRPVPEMDLDKLRIPVLVVHHEQDECKRCPYNELPRLMQGLANSPRKQLITMKGGENQGDPCEAMAYHGFNGLEKEVSGSIAQWILAG
jgi:dienelactone hydrolase